MDFELIFQITTYVISAGIGVYLYIKNAILKKDKEEKEETEEMVLKRITSFEQKMDKEMTTFNSDTTLLLKDISNELKISNKDQENNFKNISSNLQTISERVSELSTKVNELSTATTATTQQIASLEKEVVELKHELNQIKRKQELTERELNEYKIKVNVLDTRCRVNPEHLLMPKMSGSLDDNY